MSEAVPIIRTSKLTSLSSEQALANWDTIAGLLEPALQYAYGRITIEDVRKVIDEEMGMIVIAWDPKTNAVYAAFFCEIDHYVTGRKCWNISLAGGHDIDEWIHLWPVLQQIGKDQGCDHIQISGRPGWGRVLGLKEAARLYIEEI